MGKISKSAIVGFILTVLWMFTLPAQAKYNGGSGTAADPYQINDPCQLNAIGADPDDWDKHFVLTANIDMSSYSYMTAVIAPDTDTTCNFQGTAFTGTFDGAGFVISNLTIDAAGAFNDYFGLFGKIEGSNAGVKNLGLENVNVTGDDYLGGLCGRNEYGSISDCYSTGSVTGGYDSYYLGSLCGKNSFGSISDCYSVGSVTGYHYLGGLCGENHGSISNSYSASSVTGYHYLGGLCGENYGSISNCYSTGPVSGGNDSDRLGGLCGYNYYGSISNCYSTGSVTGGADSERLGGLCGSNYKSSVRDCYSTGNVSGSADSDYIGGLCGQNHYGNISNCYSTGNVSGSADSDYIGGLCGYNGYNSGSINNCYSTGSVTGGDNSNYLGGLCGRNYDGSINGCYSTGSVTGGTGFDSLGGLCGQNGGDGSISNCYFLDTAGLDNGLGTPLTESEMKQQSSFAGWNFTEIWWIDEGHDYPHLQRPTYSGSGTSEDPYQISTAEQLNEVGTRTLGWDKHFVLTADIDMAAYPYTRAVIAPDTNNSTSGFQGTSFAGIFDGAGFVISNLTIDDAGAGNDFLGLFGLAGRDSVIKNLGIENCDITGGDDSDYLGGLCGYNTRSSISNCYSTGSVTGGDDSDYLGGLCGYNREGDISNCYSTGSVTSGDDSECLGGLFGYNYESSSSISISNCYSTNSVTGGAGSYYLGSLCGKNSCGSISDCYSTGSVTGGAGSSDLGGLCGRAYNGSKISNCYSTGSVTGGDDSDCLGGLCGSNFGGHTSSNSIIRCHSTGSVTGGNYLGGLCGYNCDSLIIYCYSTGSVTGGNHLGGLCGSNYAYYSYVSISNCYSNSSVTGGNNSYSLGGLCGSNYKSRVSNCYSIGSVTSGAGSSDLGGLVGDRLYGGISNSFWDSSVNSGLTGVGNVDPDPDGVIGETTANMQIQSTFTDAGWDFVGETANGTFDIWDICEGTNYPRLSWQFLAGDFVCPDGVDLADFAVLAGTWGLSSGQAGYNDLCDLMDDDVIDLDDLAVFAENWLAGK